MKTKKAENKKFDRQETRRARKEYKKERNSYLKGMKKYEPALAADL